MVGRVPTSAGEEAGGGREKKRELVLGFAKRQEYGYLSALRGYCQMCILSSGITTFDSFRRPGTGMGSEVRPKRRVLWDSDRG